MNRLNYSLGNVMKLQLNEIFYLLSAMKDVATAKGRKHFSALQQKSLKAVYQQVFGQQDKLKFDLLLDSPLAEFHHCISSPEKAEYIVRF